MSKALFVQRRDGRVAALQFLYAWSINPPRNLADDLHVFFEGCEQPREHYAYAEELIHGVIAHQAGDALVGLHQSRGGFVERPFINRWRG